MIAGLQKRRRSPELMDQPGLDRSQHELALRGLARTNGWGTTRHRIWDVVARVARVRQLDSVKVLDIASGAGDLAIWLAKTASRKGLNLHVEGCDISAVAVEYATSRAKAAHCRNVRFFRCDVCSDGVQGAYDVVTCSLFLHHLDDAEAVRLLTIMGSLAEHAVVVDDLSRSVTGYLLAWWGSRLLTRSPVVHVDGPLSVRAAFKERELRKLAQQAHMDDVQITRHWPKRFLFVWEKP